MNNYGHVMPTQLAQAASAMDSAMDSALWGQQP
jgi:hypothetical protein